MVIRDLIARLNELDNDLSIMAKIGQASNAALFVDLFGNSNGAPAMFLSDERPLPSVKKSETLLKEIEIWVNESINYQPESNVFLVNSFDYDDGSYDFRYFKLVEVLQVGKEALLIGSDQECKNLREHFEAFDQSMLDPD